MTFATPLAAQDTGPPDTERFTSFDEQTIRNAVAPYNATVTAEVFNGVEGFLIVAGSAKILAELRACTDGTQCKGLLIAKAYAMPEGVTKAELLESINDFNAREPFVKMLLTQDGQSVLATRYVICDHGLTYGNLRIEFSALDGISSSFAREVLGLS